MTERLWLNLTIYRPPVYGPYVRVFTDTILAVESLYERNEVGEHSVLHFVGGSTMRVSESPSMITSRMAEIMK